MNYSHVLAQVQRQPRVHGYAAPCTETRISEVHGLGLFAKEAIAAGTVVAVWGGRVTTEAEMKNLPSDIGYNYALQLYPGFYLAERSIQELDAADFINHSCESNCHIGERLVMCASRNIPKDAELTADFSHPLELGGHFVCGCATPTCKGVIYTG